MSSRLRPGTLAVLQDPINFSPDSIIKVLIGSWRVKLIFIAGFALMLSVSIAFSPCKAADTWKILSPEIGIDMWIPGKVETIREDGKETGEIESYKSEDGNYIYVVTTESGSSLTTVDDVVEEVKKEVLKDDFKKSTTPIEASGQKWQGKRFQVSTENGDSSLSVQIAIDDENEEVVSQTTSAPLDSPEAKRFFDSLRIDPAAIQAERTKKTEETLKKIFNPSNPAGWFALIFAGFGCLVWLLGTVFMIIVAFRTSILWGLALFIPGGIGSLLFIVCNFQRAWPPLVVQIFGGIAIVAGVALTMVGTK